MRIGHGYDVHRLVEGRRLILGGVEIPFEKGLLGHSDADVLLHALMDAILGAAALGDIGLHFPDSDPAYAGADSLALLRTVGGMVREAGAASEAAPLYPEDAGKHREGARRPALRGQRQGHDGGRPRLYRGRAGHRSARRRPAGKKLNRTKAPAPA